MKTKVDAINVRLLEQLQQNARMPVASLARTVGLTPPAVSERLRKMEDEGLLIGYYAKLDYLKAGYQLKAIITLKVFMGKLKPLLEKVTRLQEVINCYRITGNENIIMEAVLQDQAHLEQFIDQLIVYGETKTHIVLSDIVAHRPMEML